MYTFLTAYDPLDLPGTSIDPLGFDRAYLCLADKILPGLTNVASRPRYFSIICAGALLAPTNTSMTPQKRKQVRQDTVMKLERLWVLANLLAAEEDEKLGDNASYGLRGYLYVKRYLDDLRKKRQTQTRGNFRMLSRQAPYGVLGIYGSVAEELRLVNRKTEFEITPDRGEPLGRGFITETRLSIGVKKCITENSYISLDELAEWGHRAHISASPKLSESNCMKEISPRWQEMVDLAQMVPFHEDDQRSEFHRLRRMVAYLNKYRGEKEHLRESITAIVNCETAFRLSLLAFERVLWLCRRSSVLTVDQLSSDRILLSVLETLPGVVDKLERDCNSARTPEFLKNLDRLGDVRKFLSQAAETASSIDTFVFTILERHKEVQFGKFDKGRRKAPWIDRDGNRVYLTITDVGSRRELTTAQQISPHIYRLHTLDEIQRYATSE